MFYRKDESILERYLCMAASEPSIGLIEIQKDIKNTVPLDVQISSKLKKTYEDLVLAIPDIENTIIEVRNLKRIDTPCSLLQSHIDSSLRVLDQINLNPSSSTKSSNY